jgi:hypothetical protein
MKASDDSGAWAFRLSRRRTRIRSFLRTFYGTGHRFGRDSDVIGTIYISESSQ